MKKPLSPLYIPLIVLFVFSISVLASHYYQLVAGETVFDRQFEFPFTTYSRGEVLSLNPQAQSTGGIQVGDHIEAINGRTFDSDAVYNEERKKMQEGQSVSLTVSRKAADGQQQQLETSILPVRVHHDFNFYAQFIVNFLFIYVLPTLCILLGFWVVFERPRDFLAWVLLFMLLGLSSLSLEAYPSNTLVGVYQDIFFSSWALAMLLFGIYFPERWSVDRRLPWLKWILIVPLSFQILITLLAFFRIFLGVNPLYYIKFLATAYDSIGFAVNFISIFIFFIAFGHKSTTLETPDARRRLKLMLYGTGAAMLPAFGIVFYRVVSGAKGPIFSIVPFWLAIMALLLLLLFPITMAYVIVVHRAMNVSVVVRQGLQYGLAKGGVRVLQVILLGIIALGVGWTINNYGQNLPIQVGIIIVGIALIPLIDLIAKRSRTWIDRKFFREAYNAEQILSDLSEDVRTMVETKPLLETVSSKISESLHVPQVALLLKKGDSFQSAYALGYENQPSAFLTETNQSIERLKNNEPLVVYQDDEDSWVNEEANGADRENLRELNSQLLLPFGAKNILSGIISLSPKMSEEPFSPNDLRLLKSVAAQTGLALENSRLTEAIVLEAAQRERLNTEIEIAREVQERLFPQELPRVEGLDFYGACRPALGVGGDYYDFLQLPNNKFGLAVGDVSGKGIGAALMMASLQASLRGQAMQGTDDLARLMGIVNELLYEASTTNRYATFFYGQYESSTRKLVYVNAGHNPPFLIRPKADDFEVIRPSEGGAVVGMLPSFLARYTQGEIELQPGDLFVGYTDGISEAMNPQEEEWGEDNMLEELKKVIDKPANEILPYIVARADEFANGAKQHDDMTMIVIKVL